MAAATVGLQVSRPAAVGPAGNGGPAPAVTAGPIEISAALRKPHQHFIAIGSTACGAMLCCRTKSVCSSPPFLAYRRAAFERAVAAPLAAADGMKCRRLAVAPAPRFRRCRTHYDRSATADRNSKLFNAERSSLWADASDSLRSAGAGRSMARLTQKPQLI